MSSSTASSFGKHLLRASRRLTKGEDGAVLVELSLVAPFMLLLSAGVFEFSNILHTRLLIEAGVEDAARYVARCNDTWANCIARAGNLAVDGVVSGGSPRVSGWTAADLTFTPLTFDTTDPDTGSEIYRSGNSVVTIVEVSTSHAYTGTGLWSYLGFGALNITTSHQERVLGS
jgi:hypothetical protein